MPSSGYYRSTEDDDPRHLYHNVLIAIDAERMLNNGQPSGLAIWLDALDLKEGSTVVHMGCGLGYYTAIAAETVGPTGSVTGIEVDPVLASKAALNVSDRPNVTVLNESAASYDPESSDAVLVNAGVTHPRRLWLERLLPGGRLIFPLTFAQEGAAVGTGFMLKVSHEPTGYAASVVSPVGIYHCIGLRDDEMNLKVRDMMVRGTWMKLKSARLDQHEPDDSCVLHSSEVCLSAAPTEN